MTFTLKHKIQILISMLFYAITLISCKPQPQLISSSSSPTSIATVASVASASTQHPISTDMPAQYTQQFRLTSCLHLNKQ